MKKNKKIDRLCQISKSATIDEISSVKGHCVIEEDVQILGQSYIFDSKIGRGSRILSSFIEESEVGENCVIGPFAHLRPGSKIGNNVKIGNFVEVKNSSIANGCKAAHLAYIGDAELGENVNVGCGAIFVNFNGREKNKTRVGKNCFVGSNVNVIAPVEIADDTFICAGTTLTKNTEKGDFVIGRERETIKKDRAKKYLEKKK